MDLQDDQNYLSDLDDEMQDHTSDDEEETVMAATWKLK